ncbi:MAG: hypothetical protein WCE44_07740 [Candidatus Velthaea sp.]
MYTPHSAFESTDTVNRVVALLVRFPEIHSIRSNPADDSLTLSYAVGRKLDRDSVRAFSDTISEHVCAILELRGEAPATFSVTAERDSNVTFVNVTRDFASFSREELELQIGIFEDRFGALLVKNPAADEPLDDDDTVADQELVESALEALRDPAQRKRLVGFREEKRVLVYFVHSNKTKARARS